MCSGKQIIDGIYKLCYNIRIVCGANGRVAFLSSKARKETPVRCLFLVVQVVRNPPYLRWLARGAKNKIVRINSTVFERRHFGSVNPPLSVKKGIPLRVSFFFIYRYFCLQKLGTVSAPSFLILSSAGK